MNETLDVVNTRSFEMVFDGEKRLNTGEFGLCLQLVDRLYQYAKNFSAISNEGDLVITHHVRQGAITFPVKDYDKNYIKFSREMMGLIVDQLFAFYYERIFNEKSYYRNYFNPTSVFLSYDPFGGPLYRGHYLEIFQISYNSPVNVTLKGTLYALIFAAFIGGGEFDFGRDGVKAKMPGIGRTVQQIRDAIFPVKNEEFKDRFKEVSNTNIDFFMRGYMEDSYNKESDN